MSDQPHFDAHLFVCTNRKAEGKPSCAPKGAEALRDSLKEAAARWSEKFPGKRIRVNASGCLGQCAKGISAVCYPRGEWLLELKNDPDSIEKCLQLLERQR